MTVTRWLLYGAYGYTGQLLAEEAVRRGHRPVLAGRDPEKLAPLASRLGLEHRVVGLTDPAALRGALAGSGLVLHAAGPFVRTSRPMVEACLAVGASYVDITGELPVFEEVLARDAEARARKVALLPGAGFDVVPSDCLARFVAQQVAGADQLEVAVAALGKTSGGTARSALLQLVGGSRVRREGRLVPVALGRGVRRIPFPDRERWAVPVPLGDLATAFHSTGIPNITTYLTVPKRWAQGLRVGWPAAALALPLARAALRSPGVLPELERRLGRWTGPDEQAREEGRAYLWARARVGDGAWSEAMLQTCEPYRFTAQSGIRVVEELLRQRPLGALTPAGAFGPDFVLGIAGTQRGEPHQAEGAGAGCGSELPGRSSRTPP